VLNNTFLSPFYSQDALTVAAKYFPFINVGIPEDNFPFISGRRYMVFKTLELVGNQYADYRSVASPEDVFKALSSLQEREYKRHIVEFGCVAEADVSRAAIETWIRGAGLIVYRRGLSRAPYLSIDCSWVEYKARKRGKFWHNISRAEKLLESKWGDLVFKTFEAPQHIPAILERCMALYKENWDKFTSSSLFISEKGRFFLNELLVRLSGKGNAEICTLEQKGSILAFSIGLKQDSKYYFYVFATKKSSDYATYSVGKIHLTYLLESVFSRGFKIFDFMAGEESYKYEWTKTSQERVSYYVVPKNIINSVMLASFRFSDCLVDFLKAQKILRYALRAVSALRK